ncbi:MAG: anti-sigma factor family protein, partial [Planctomycetota bacterium]
MNCKQMTQHLHEWVDGELREPTREQVKEHLEACPDCSKHVKAIGHLKHLVQVKTVRPPVPAGLEARIRESIAAEALTERQPRILRRPPRARLLWAAALLLFILPALLFFWPNPRDVHAEIAEHNFHSHLDSVTGVDGTPRFSCDGRAMAQKILREELGLSVILPIFPGARVRYEGVSFEDY